MHIFILIEKDPCYKTEPVIEEVNKIPGLSVAAVVDKYQGFEGLSVCYFEVEGNTTAFRKKLDECLDIKRFGSCLLLHLLSVPSKMPSFLKSNVVKLGYDVGWCFHDHDLDDPDDASIFSSIFHEVLFGLCEELVFYKDLLNEHLLFPTKALAQSYVKTHDRLSAEGKNVEDYMKMVIYEVWRHQTDIVPLG